MPPKPPTSNTAWVHIGKIAGAHGLDGRVKIVSFSQKPESLFGLGGWFDREGNLFYTPTQWHPLDSSRGRFFLVTLEGIHSCQQAQNLKGHDLYVPRESLPILDEDQFYHVDLMNLWAYTLEGDILGQVSKIHNFGAQDILEIHNATTTQICTVPFSYDAVPGVDLKSACLYIDKKFILGV